MNEIKKKVLKDELKYDNTVILVYRIEYPEITKSDYEFGKNMFNRYNSEMAKRLERYILNTLYYEAKELYEYNTANGYPIMQYEIIQEYEITYNEDTIVSLYYDNYEFRGGAHGNTIRNSQNWNLKEGRMIPLWKLYPNNPYFVLDILKDVVKQIRKQIEDGSNYYFENFGELVIDTFNPKNFYLTDKCIVVFFQQYDIAPYSSGIPVFYINY